MKDTKYTQTEFKVSKIVPALLEILESESVQRPFFVVGKAFRSLDIANEIKAHYPAAKFFENFTANPIYESVVLGINDFREKECDFIIAIGGGSTIDVAKCIKAFAFMDDTDCCLNQTITDNSIKILAVPTTAGTGSEATHFAVIYYNGEKKSVSHKSLLPEYVILCEKGLESLPVYQRKTTMLDILCHSIESLWSVNSTEVSGKFASDAIELFVGFYKSYLGNETIGSRKMLYAANYAVKAINITKTTAPHAMSYKMTSLYGISHGHSVALCLPRVWEYMTNNLDKCVDARGAEFLNASFQYISRLLNCDNVTNAINWIDNLIFKELELEPPKLSSEEELLSLVRSVNTERLANNPIILDDLALAEIYNSCLENFRMNE